ncbi:MAG: FecR domain-containing protein, partial [Elusimicrobia bacterium]|nr:FecR domain-containing protein [Elusimicrobiota bacterium]
MKTLTAWALIITVTLFSANFLGASQKSVAAIVTSISGTFLVKPSGQKDFLAASVGQFLYEGDVGKTLQNSMAAITFVSGVQVKINANTEFTINLKELGKMDEEVTVNEGQVFSKVLRKGSQFGVRTELALAAVRGTEFDVKVSPPIKTKRKIRVKVKRSEILLKGLENLVRELKFAYEREANEREAKRAAELRAKE